jgi:hypothetical protein
LAYRIPGCADLTGSRTETLMLNPSQRSQAAIRCGGVATVFGGSNARS